jgi:hypothetical protein
MVIATFAEVALTSLNKAADGKPVQTIKVNTTGTEVALTLLDVGAKVIPTVLIRAKCTEAAHVLFDHASDTSLLKQQWLLAHVQRWHLPC